MKLVDQEIVGTLDEHIELLKILDWKMFEIVGDDCIGLPPKSSAEDVPIIYVWNAVKGRRKTGGNQLTCLRECLDHCVNPAFALYRRVSEVAF